MTTPDDIVDMRKADPPFDDPEGDVIIRSSDNVDFYVFKSFLTYSSAVFKDMFCIAQGNAEELKDGLQVILTDDTSETWNLLLRFSYPLWAAGPSTLKSLDEFSRTMESSRKYEIVGAEHLIAAELVAPRFLETEPMRVFALACRYGLDTEARVAAKHTSDAIPRAPVLRRNESYDCRDLPSTTRIPPTMWNGGEQCGYKYQVD